MQNTAEEKKEPLKLRIILPLLGVILVLSLIFVAVNISKDTFPEMAGPELAESFNDYATKKESLDHYKLFVSQKKVRWEQGPSLAGFLEGIEGSNTISSVALSYQIPVFINLAGEWIFSLHDNQLSVQAPMPTFGEAVLDPSSLEINFKSAITDEQKSIIKDTLKENIAAYRVALDSSSRAELESQSRLKVEDFLRDWLISTYKEVPDLKYQISFSGSSDADLSDPSEEP